MPSTRRQIGAQERQPRCTNRVGATILERKGVPRRQLLPARNKTEGEMSKKGSTKRLITSAVKKWCQQR
eukprot:8775245-Heterocapsa_arctica.AAC.1